MTLLIYYDNSQYIYIYYRRLMFYCKRGVANYSSPSSAEVKIAWSHTSTSPRAFMAWCLI